MNSPRKQIELLLQHRAVVALRQAAAEIGDVQVHLVGGALRDRLLGRASFDLDVTVSDNAPAVAQRAAQRLGARLVALGGDRFGALRLVHRDIEVDLWDRQGGSLYDDLARRDLTINSVALDLEASLPLDLDGEAPHLPDRSSTPHGSPEAARGWVDPFGGLTDVRSRRLRATTERSFDDDPLRVLRLARFHAQLDGFQVVPETLALARQAVGLLPKVASERVRQEIEKMLIAPNVGAGIDTLRRLGLEPGLWLGSPEADLSRTTGLSETTQADDGHAPERLDDDLLPRLERFDNAIRWLDATRRESVVDHRLGRLALIFAGLDSGPGVDRPIDRFREAGFCSKRDAASVALLLAFGSVPTDAAELAQKLNAMGARWPTAICVAAARFSTPPEGLMPVLALIEQRGDEIFNPPKLIGGDQAARLLGVDAGPQLGRGLEALRNAQIEGRVRSEAEAVSFLERLREEAGRHES